MSRRARLEKMLTYRSNGPVELSAHTAHWTGFTWEAGPVRVKCWGPWGEVQVWASSRGEADRVIGHAAAIAGWDVLNDPRFDFEEVTVTAERYGRVAPMGLRYQKGLPCVSSRIGPSGGPNWDAG